MSARPGQRRKVYPSKYLQYKDGSTNGDISRILTRSSPPIRTYNKVHTENKTPRSKSPIGTHSRERGCLPIVNYNNNHVMPVADGKQGFPKLPATDGKQNFQEMPIDECRQIYKEEINTLWREVEEFRITCRKEMVRQRALLDKHRRQCEEAVNNGNSISRAPDVTEDKDYTNDLKALKENMQALEKKQTLLDQEEELVEREEQLVKRQEKLKEYEKDVQEAEALLDKRQNIATRRSQDVEFLNHDLLTIKQDLEETINKVENTMDGSEISNDVSGEQTTSYTSTAINSPEASCKARRNWQLARRHLIDKVSVLETTIQRYRTQVASSSANITAKDMVISRLQKEVKTTELRDELDLKEKKIKKLESQLALSIEDKTRSERKLEMLLEELQNIDLNATAKALSSPEKTPSKSDPTNKRKLMKKQNSMFSFLAHHVSDKFDKRENSLSPRLFRRRTSGDKGNTKSGPNTPLKGSSKDSEAEDVRSESGNTHTEPETNQDAGVKDNTDSLAEYTDDLGSKACSVM